MKEKKEINLSLWLSKKEYDALVEARKKILLEDGKLVSISEVMRRALHKEYIGDNSSPPETPSKESVEKAATEQSSDSWGNIDF